MSAEEVYGHYFLAAFLFSLQDAYWLVYELASSRPWLPEPERGPFRDQQQSLDENEAGEVSKVRNLRRHSLLRCFTCSVVTSINLRLSASLNFAS